MVWYITKVGKKKESKTEVKDCIEFCSLYIFCTALEQFSLKKLALFYKVEKIFHFRNFLRTRNIFINITKKIQKKYAHTNINNTFRKHNDVLTKTIN